MAQKPEKERKKEKKKKFQGGAYVYKVDGSRRMVRNGYVICSEKCYLISNLTRINKAKVSQPNMHTKIRATFPKDDIWITR